MLLSRWRLTSLTEKENRKRTTDDKEHRITLQSSQCVKTSWQINGLSCSCVLHFNRDLTACQWWIMSFFVISCWLMSTSYHHLSVSLDVLQPIRFIFSEIWIFKIRGGFSEGFRCNLSCQRVPPHHYLKYLKSYWMDHCKICDCSLAMQR